MQLRTEAHLLKRLKHVLVSVALFVICTVGSFAGEHPVPLDSAIESSKCYECHEDKAKGKVVHAAIESGCTTCHRVGNADDITSVELTSATSLELCLSCHADKAAKPGIKVHAPVAKECVTCHSPHTADNKQLLLKPTSGGKNENQCLGCHEKMAAAPSKGSRHAALDMGCETCHVTHKSGNPGEDEFAFHLKKTAPALCLDCHDPKQKTFTTAHGDQPVVNANCSNCHDAHVSPFPKLINANAHPPFAEKACDACHQPANAGKVVLNESGNRQLCYTCHDAMKDKVEKSKAQHAAFSASDTCTSCHNPHATRDRKLMKMAQGEVCATCHIKSADTVQHGPYATGKCANCHDAHGTETAKLLRAEGNTLCRGCHVLGQNGVKIEGQSVSMPWQRDMTMAEYSTIPKIGLDRTGETGHPVVRHPIAGKNTKAAPGQPATLECRTCHEAHSSNVANLIPNSAKDSVHLCEQCHK